MLLCVGLLLRDNISSNCLRIRHRHFYYLSDSMQGDGVCCERERDGEKIFLCFSYLTFPVKDLLDIFTARHIKMMEQTRDDACTDWDQSNIFHRNFGTFGVEEILFWMLIKF